MKKVISLILSLALMMAFTACNARTAVDPEAFAAAAEEVGFTVVTYSNENISDDGYDKVVLAKSEYSNAEIIVFETEKQAKETYADAVYSTKSDKVTIEKEVQSSTYAKFYCTNGDEYTAICRIGNSMFYGKEDDNNGMVRKLMEKIGY